MLRGDIEGTNRRIIAGVWPGPPTRKKPGAAAMEKTKVKVGNIHRDATTALLRSFFEFHGHILRAQYAAPKPPCPHAQLLKRAHVTPNARQNQRDAGDALWIRRVLRRLSRQFGALVRPQQLRG